LFREGMLRTIQRLLPEAVLEEAGDLASVLALAKSGAELDSLILDLRFPGLRSVSMIAQLRQQLPRTSIIVVSMVDNQDLISEVMACGADGFIGKSISPEEIGQAILAIREGEVVVKYAPSGLLLPLEASDELSQLTTRQQEVLRLIARGQTNKEIARELDISPFTVRIHVSSLLHTLKVSSRAAAAAKFAEAWQGADSFLAEPAPLSTRPIEPAPTPLPTQALALLEHWLGDSPSAPWNEYITEQVAKGVLHAFSPAQWQQLADVLPGKPEYWQQRCAASLGENRSAPAIALLKSLLQDSPYLEVQVTAIHELDWSEAPIEACYAPLIEAVIQRLADEQREPELNNLLAKASAL
jgi:DNA-binding NarL/FixJ family response regulator